AYDLLTGQLPFRGDLPRLIHMHTNVSPSPPSTINPSISKAVDAVILRALAKKPEDRYPSIIEFAGAFQKAVRSDEKGEDVHMVLVVSEIEAMIGTKCSLILPGEQTLTVTIPAGTKSGDTISLEGKGKMASYGGPSGDLCITLSTRPDASNEEV